MKSSFEKARYLIESEINHVMQYISQPHTVGRKGEIVQEIIDYVNNHLQDSLLSAYRWLNMFSTK